MFRRHPSVLIFLLVLPLPLRTTLFPYTTLFRSSEDKLGVGCGLQSSASELFYIHLCFSAIHLELCTKKMNRNFRIDRKSTRLNSSHVSISYAVFCLKKKSARKEPGVWPMKGLAK